MSPLFDAALEPQPRRPDTSSVPLCANFQYYSPEEEGIFPSANNLELVLGDVDQDTRTLPVHDVRAYPKVDWSKTLDTKGFAFITRSKWTHVSPDMTDAQIHDGEYPSDLEEVIHQLYPLIPPSSIQIHHLGFIFRGRSSTSTKSNTGTDTNAQQFTNASFTSHDPAWNRPNRGSAPAGRVHIDFTRHGVTKVLSTAFGPSSIAVQSIRNLSNTQRMVCLSLWRPLRPVHRDPFAVCDNSTVRTGELAKIPRVWPNGEGYERIAVKASIHPEAPCHHQWYYMSTQTPEEMCVVKLCDTANGWTDWEGAARTEKGQNTPVGCGAPHCSFHVEGTEDLPARESIEWRVVLFLPSYE